MIDPDAPVNPGQSAAGIRVGSPIADVLSATGKRLTPEPLPHHGTRYRSEMVDVWEHHGVITQVSVHGSYRGKLMRTIGVGSTIAEIADLIGPCEEDDEDNLAIRGVAGFCFDAEGDWPPAPNGVDFGHPAVRAARVTAMYVFRRADSSQ